MKTFFQRMFRPILSPFEKNTDPSLYRTSHRVVLRVVGILFLVLTAGSGQAARYADDAGFFIPVVVFFVLGFVSLVIGFLGSDGAVAKIWGNRK